MPRNVLLILAETTEGSAVRRALMNSRDGPFRVEWVSRCCDALERLGRRGGDDFAAIVVDLFLPDSQGIETFDKLFRRSPHIPILGWSRLGDEDVARLALQRGAQDYLVAERLDDYSLLKALTSMLERSTYADA
jgi:DNA-binding NarL/FixJ family response regulator